MFAKDTSLKEILKNAGISILISDPIDDWDMEDTPSKGMRQSTIIELIVGILVNWVFNMLLLAPVFLTGSNIIHRHQILEEANIGIKETEAASYRTVMTMMVVAPLAVTVSALVECVLMMVYHFHLHPWKGILEGNEEQTLAIELKQISMGKPEAIWIRKASDLITEDVEAKGKNAEMLGPESKIGESAALITEDVETKEKEAEMHDSDLLFGESAALITEDVEAKRKKEEMGGYLLIGESAVQISVDVETKGTQAEMGRSQFLIRESADLIKEDVEAEINGYSSEENMTGMD